MITTNRDQVIERLKLSQQVVNRLDTYVELLEAEQTKMNLVGASTLPIVWVRHMICLTETRVSWLNREIAEP